MVIEEVDRPPRLPVLYGAAVAGLLPGRRSVGDTVPERVLVQRGARADRARLAEYSRVCGFRLADSLPATYPHVLAFPLALRLMTSRGFPFPAAGVVHLANRIELGRPIDADEPLDLAVHAEALRDHPRGRQVDVVATASVGDAEVWRGVSTYLHRTGAPTRPGAGGRDDRDAPPVVAVWQLETKLGRAYAAVSGDHNPIHTSRLAARAFGFRRRIAHGMWTKARCLAQLAGRLPAGYTVEVSFQAPVLLPSAVEFAATGFAATAPTAGGDFTVHHRSSGKRHLTGKVRPATNR